MCVINYKGNGTIGGSIRAWKYKGMDVFRTLNTQNCDFRNKLGNWLMWKEDTYLIL